MSHSKSQDQELRETVAILLKEIDETNNRLEHNQHKKKIANILDTIDENKIAKNKIININSKLNNLNNQLKQREQHLNQLKNEMQMKLILENDNIKNKNDFIIHQNNQINKLNSIISNKNSQISEYNNKTIIEYKEGYGLRVVQSIGLTFSLVMLLVCVLFSFVYIKPEGDEFLAKYRSNKCISPSYFAWELSSHLYRFKMNLTMFLVFGILFLLCWIVCYIYKTKKQWKRLKNLELTFLIVVFGNFSMFVWWSIEINELYEMYKKINDNGCEVKVNGLKYDINVNKAHLVIILVVGIIMLWLCGITYLLYSIYCKPNVDGRKVVDRNGGVYERVPLKYESSTDDSN